ncbi:MAG: hypothetical protein ABW321_13580, partial [Polyangiales bacterium]
MGFSRRVGAALVIILGVVGCDAQPPDGVFVCVESVDCPRSQRCIRGVCRASVPLELDEPEGGRRDAALPQEAGPEAGQGGNTASAEAGGGPGTAAEGGAGASAGAEAGAAAPSTAGQSGAGAATGAAGISAAAGGGAVPAAAGGGAESGSPASGSAGARGGSSDGNCACHVVDACCDGCQPLNEGASCVSDTAVPECAVDTCRGGYCFRAVN